MTESTELDRPFLSVVVPVFQEPDCISPFLARLRNALSLALIDSYEIIFSIDPSTDETFSRIEVECHRDKRVRALLFSRRIGQPMATIAGLEHSLGMAVVVMDIDLQDPPELIPEMVAKWKQGFLVVSAKRRSRVGETMVKKLTVRIGYSIIKKFGTVEILPNTGDFRLMDRRVVDELARFTESHGFLRGLTSLVGFKQTSIEFDRPARHSGSGNYNRLFGSLRIGLDGIVGFSSALLNLSTMFGFLTAFLSFLVGASYVMLKIMGFPFPIGNASIVTLILFVGGIQLICLGIAGQYISRIYDEVKRRPRYIIDRKLG